MATGAPALAKLPSFQTLVSVLSGPAVWALLERISWSISSRTGVPSGFSRVDIVQEWCGDDAAGKRSLETHADGHAEAAADGIVAFGNHIRAEECRARRRLDCRYSNCSTATLPSVLPGAAVATPSCGSVKRKLVRPTKSSPVVPPNGAR